MANHQGQLFRQMMLQLAAQSAGTDETPENVVKRASDYAKFVLESAIGDSPPPEAAAAEAQPS